MTGLNLQEGQSLAVKMEPENLDAAVAVAKAAYARGARYVEIWPESSRLARTRLDHSRPEYLEFTPEHRVRRNEEFVRDKWALLSIKSPVDLSVMDGADAARSGNVARGVRTADETLRRALSNDHTQWTVMAFPSPAWAGQVLGMEPGEEALLALWKVMEPILRLNHDDPDAYWHHHREVLQERTKKMNDLAIRTLHFQAEGTDLRVPLHERARWLGGGAVTPDGVPFLPNVPTEEVYTAPFAPGDREGRVRVTKPVRVYGTLVDGAWFEFADGKVVDFGADRGRDTLETFFEIDEGSRRMGEIAVVDGGSPIARSGLVFQNILLDENAACHFALGSAYPTSLDGGDTMDEAELERHGANQSKQHVDFMIGSDAMSIRAVLADGSERSIMESGRITV